MEVSEQLQLALLVPGQDQAWLEVNWLHGASVTASQRAGLVDWLVEVSSYLNLSDITLFLAVSLFDRTLAVVEVEEEQLQITAITCLHLAAKVEEDFVPAPSLLLPLLGGQQAAGGEAGGEVRGEAGGEAGGQAGGQEAGGEPGEEAGGEPGGEEAVGEGETDVREMEMAKTERMILKAVDFHLRTCTAATFLHYFNQLLPEETRRVGRLAKAILDLSLLSPWHGQVQPSHLAAAVLSLANCLLEVPLALPINLAASLLQVPTLLSKDLHLCKVLPSCNTLLFRLITLLEAKEEMPGVLRKHKKVLSKLSLETLARLGQKLEVRQDFGVFERER